MLRLPTRPLQAIQPKAAVDPRGFEEPARRRAWREFAARLHSGWFWLSEFLGAAAVGAAGGWWALIYVVGLLALVAAIAVMATPVFQRNEARAEVGRLERLANADFLLAEECV